MKLYVWKGEGHWRYSVYKPGLMIYGHQPTWKQALDVGLQELARLAGL